MVPQRGVLSDINRSNTVSDIGGRRLDEPPSTTSENPLGVLGERVCREEGKLASVCRLGNSTPLRYP